MDDFRRFKVSEFLRTKSLIETAVALESYIVTFIAAPFSLITEGSLKRRSGKSWTSYKKYSINTHNLAQSNITALPSDGSGYFARRRLTCWVT